LAFSGIGTRTSRSAFQVSTRIAGKSVRCGTSAKRVEWGIEPAIDGTAALIRIHPVIRIPAKFGYRTDPDPGDFGDGTR
jgi:hypothetical protein